MLASVNYNCNFACILWLMHSYTAKCLAYTYMYEQRNSQPPSMPYKAKHFDINDTILFP